MIELAKNIPQHFINRYWDRKKKKDTKWTAKIK